MQQNKLKWRSDFEKQVVVQNFDKKGWIKATNEGTTIFVIYIYIYIKYKLRRMEYILGDSMDSEADIQPRDRSPIG